MATTNSGNKKTGRQTREDPREKRSLQGEERQMDRELSGQTQSGQDTWDL